MKKELPNLFERDYFLQKNLALNNLAASDSLYYHVVWVGKYRRRALKPGVCTYLQKVLPKLLRSMPGVTIDATGFD